MIVDVAVIGHEVFRHDLQVGTHQGVHDLTHGEHDPAEEHQALAQFEAAPLDVETLRDSGEQLVFQRLDGLVHALDRFEMAVNDVVQQAVQQEADAELGQVGAAVPAFDDGADVQPVVLADSDQCLRGDEGAQFTGGQLARGHVQPCPVGGQEQVAAVTVELGALVFIDGVLDGQGVKPEFVAQHGEIVAVGVAQVKPYGHGLIGQVITDLGHGKALKLEPPIPVQARPRLAPGRGDFADGGGRHGAGIAAVEGLDQQRPGAQHAAGRGIWIAWPAGTGPVAGGLRVHRAVWPGLRWLHGVLLASTEDARRTGVRCVVSDPRAAGG